MADSRCLSSRPQVCMPASVCACVCVCTSVHVCVRVWQRPYTARQSGCCWVLPDDTGLSYLFVRNEYQQELERPSVCDPKAPCKATQPSPFRAHHRLRGRHTGFILDHMAQALDPTRNARPGCLESQMWKCRMESPTCSQKSNGGLPPSSPCAFSDTANK